MVGLEFPKLSPNLREPFTYPTFILFAFLASIKQTSSPQIIVGGTISMPIESWCLVIKTVRYQTKDWLSGNADINHFMLTSNY